MPTQCVGCGLGVGLGVGFGVGLGVGLGVGVAVGIGVGVSVGAAVVAVATRIATCVEVAVGVGIVLCWFCPVAAAAALQMHIDRMTKIDAQPNPILVNGFWTRYQRHNRWCGSSFCDEG